MCLLVKHNKNLFTSSFKVKRFLKHIMLFASIFFIIDKGAYFILNKTSELEYDKRLEDVLEGNMNKDIFVLGSSRGSGNIIASQLERETGYSSYNLSYQGANILYQEFVLKTLLKFNTTPKKVIIAIDNPYEFNEETTLHFRNDRLYPLAKYDYINNQLIAQGERSVLSKVLYLTRLNGSMFRMKAVKSPGLNPFESCGSRPIILIPKDGLVYDCEVVEYSKSIETQSYVDAFNSIKLICKAHDIDLIFVFPPNFKVFNNSFKKRFDQLVSLENKVFVYDTLNTVYKNTKYFYDASHLTKEGAEVFTSEISTFINQNK